MKIHFQHNTALFNEVAAERVFEIGCASLLTMGIAGFYPEQGRVNTKWNK